MRKWEHCCSLGKAIPVMAVDTGSCSQRTLCIFSHWLTPFPLMLFNIPFITWTPVVRMVTHQIAVWLGFGFAWRTSSGRERSGHSDICEIVKLQILDFYFHILVSHARLVSSFNGVHLLRDGFCLVCWELKVQGTKPGKGTPKGIDDLHLGL